MNATVKCGPENCPIVGWSSLSASQQRAQRKERAEQLYKQGFTMGDIAALFGVAQSTITEDLRNLSTVDKLKSAKTASNPKGAGRPKGSSKRTGPQEKRRVDQREAASLVLDQGMSYDQAAEATDTTLQVVRASVAREEGRREPQVVRADLSMTAQQKFDAALRQHRATLDARFRHEIAEEVRRRIDEIVLPHWKEKIEQAQQLYARRKGLMDKETFNTIRRALHPDSRNSISDAKLAEAFDTFMGLEKYLLDERDSPTQIGPLPDNLAAWDKMRRRARARPSGRTAMARR